MSIELLIERLLEAPPPNYQASGVVDEIEIGDETVSFRCPFSLSV
jgi:hypothetical protein